MLDTSEIRKGLKVVFDGVPFEVTYFQFVKPGKGQAFTRTKRRNMITGTTIERTFKSGEKLEKADMEERQMQYLYKDGSGFCFMDTENYEQIHMTEESLGDSMSYLLPESTIRVEFYEGNPVGIELPATVDLKVTDTAPGIKGATASAQTKPATCETGVVITVPSFINPGDVVRINTESGEYQGRA